jgi:hypothetical protein
MTPLNMTLSNPLPLAAPEEFAEKLVQEEQQRKIDEYHWKLVQEALDRNEWQPMTSDFWDRIHQKAEQIRQTCRKEN